MLINLELCGPVGRQHGSARREQLDHTVSSAGPRRLSGVECGAKSGQNAVMSWIGSGAVDLKQVTFMPPVLLIGFYLSLNALLG